MATAPSGGSAATHVRQPILFQIHEDNEAGAGSSKATRQMVSRARLASLK